ncbi:MAG: cytochrome c [Planctomycetota bacterium]
MRQLLAPAASLALCSLIWLNLACEPAKRIAPPGSTPTSGAQLYIDSCARCHGVDGDGKGETELATPARNFKAGGFAFGNTREALFKVVTFGMPGRSAMPGFKNALSEGQRWRIVDHLLTLVPQQNPIDSKASRFEPIDRPIIARGSLPPIKKEMSDHARGLMIGYPGGMSFEFDVDPPRLLRARNGGFVDRRDWGGRGGLPLKPLGKVFYEVRDGSPSMDTRRRSGPNLGHAQTRFLASFAKKDIAGIEWSFGPDVVETIKPVATDGGFAFERRWVIKGRREAGQKLILDRRRPKSIIAKSAVKGEAAGSTLWWHRASSGKGRSVYRINFGSGVEVSPGVELALTLTTGDDDLDVSILVICTPDWNDDTLDLLKKEFDR